MTRRTALLPGYVLLAATDAALAGRKIRRARWLTKPALMPALAAVALAGDNTPDAGTADSMILAGLGLSWLGDVALLGEGDGPFSIGLGSFLAAHICYLVALLRRRKGAPWRRPWVGAGYGMAWLALNALLWNRTGRLRIPVLIYGTALSAMALAAFDTDSPATAAGGAAFLLSDSILALDRFEVVKLPAPDSIVMATYTAAQALIGLSMANPTAARW